LHLPPRPVFRKIAAPEKRVVPGQAGVATRRIGEI
jgi:hypothetical protein